MIDTHAHIYTEEFGEDLDEVIQRSKEIGISKILMPNIDHESIDLMLDVEKSYPDYCYSMMGLHPCSVKEDFEKHLYEVEEWLGRRKFLAVGEMGTDLHWDKTFWEQQKEAFKIQCELALKHNLPIVIHCRESIDETIELVTAFYERGLKGVFHCFTGNAEQANRITSMGFYLGIGGVATFKNGGLNEVIPSLDRNKIVLETDSPYLAPTPNRGKRNEPAFVRLVAEKVAEYLNLSIQEVNQLTTTNANALFFPSE
ncbi:MAG: TatD family hydrolase [Ekhidna sp.]